ncbi:DUF2799 domain-containing protein [Vibrio fluvialis]|uniref:DUF2799 domain-containing protein n=1 Tax=Vibrio fluvialis TaxID=676 RepID=A0AAX2LNQ4_VIBFL|nr:DUF2799 domain-containing protein [Vibrio fluvialis]TNF11341.1 MAG: DUF2799 domain-containing protein [Vibrionaceae bacterium]AMF93616.1 DUF2799 domain-containing protein [Vibrio fluvialis]EKO3377633.1 DUF2799 domain-containing protein [Vibrio fluvialis]EKO3381855.1 DUF2799 domain-containing protein [Vibrio fluvialis]EKO3404366.1 DUF2799 domain-containing protein [Vibrio fluvialis]
MKKIMMMLVVVGLMGCAASDSELAKQGDWYQIGYKDGATGHTQRSNKALAELGQANQADYNQGYVEGVNEYCNPNFAYQMGVNGQYYEGVCEGTEQAQKFRMEWQRGWNEYNN